MTRPDPPYAAGLDPSSRDARVHTHIQLPTGAFRRATLDLDVKLDSDDLTGQPIKQVLTTTDYSSIRQRERLWARDTLGSWQALESTAPQLAPLRQLSATRQMLPRAQTAEPGARLRRQRAHAQPQPSSLAGLHGALAAASLSG